MPARRYLALAVQRQHTLPLLLPLRQAQAL